MEVSSLEDGIFKYMVIFNKNKQFLNKRKCKETKLTIKCLYASRSYTNTRKSLRNAVQFD